MKVASEAEIELLAKIDTWLSQPAHSVGEQDVADLRVVSSILWDEPVKLSPSEPFEAFASAVKRAHERLREINCSLTRLIADTSTQLGRGQVNPAKASLTSALKDQQSRFGRSVVLSFARSRHLDLGIDNR